MTATIDTDFPGGQGGADTQCGSAVGEQDTPAAITVPAPRVVAPRGPQAGLGHRSDDTPGRHAPATDPPDGQYPRGTQVRDAVGDRTPPPRPMSASTPKQPPAGVVEIADPLLALLADSLDDLERTRIANQNRLRQLTRDVIDSDGGERGFALPAEHPVVTQITAVLDGIAALEHAAELNLARRLRQHPLGTWVKATKGVGEKQGARLLAAIGDPYWHSLHDRPRGLYELYAYCGLHNDEAGTAVRRTKGVKSNWSSTAKSRAYLIADSCIKQRCAACKEFQEDRPGRHAETCACSPYRVIYDEAREKYAYAVYRDGLPLSPGHQDNRARRYVAKQVLKDLWRAAREIHNATGAAR